MTAYHHVNAYEVHDRHDADRVVGTVFADSLPRAQRKLDRIAQPEASLYVWMPSKSDTLLADAEAVLGDTRRIEPSPLALRGIATMQDPRGIVETIAAGFRAQREPCIHDLAKGTTGAGDDDA